MEKTYDRHYTEALKDVASYYKISKKLVTNPDVIRLAVYAEDTLNELRKKDARFNGIEFDDFLAAALFSATYNLHFNFDFFIEHDPEFLYQLFNEDGTPYLAEGERKEK